MKLLIDTDVGTDDAAALILALRYKNPVPDILGITTVFGNVASVEQAIANANRILRLVERPDVPIYAGASEPLINVKVKNESHSSSEYHGHDGMGDRPDIEPALHPSDFHNVVPNVHASVALINIVVKNPGKGMLANAIKSKTRVIGKVPCEPVADPVSREVTLVCLGPLTNVALALKLQPSIGQKLKNIVLMGGNIHATGNVLSFTTAEYNFYKDPEAAHIVLEEVKVPITIVPWEAYLWHSVDRNFEETYYGEKSKISRFMRDVTETGRAILKQWDCRLSLCDELAMAVALNPSIVVKSEKHLASVELYGERTRGQVVIDWKHAKTVRPNVEFVTEYDIEKAQNMLLDSVM